MRLVHLAPASAERAIEKGGLKGAKATIAIGPTNSIALEILEQLRTMRMSRSKERFSELPSHCNPISKVQRPREGDSISSSPNAEALIIGAREEAQHSP